MASEERPDGDRPVSDEQRPADAPAEADRTQEPRSKRVRLPRDRRRGGQAASEPEREQTEEPRPRRPAPDAESRPQPEFHPETQAEIYRGAKPGTRYARMTRARERAFERAGAEGTIRATPVVDVPRTFTGRVWRSVKRLMIGAPLATSRLAEERLSKLKALAIFASDALSSNAYATEEILLILILAGTGALGYSIPISIAIAVLLVIVAASYRQTIRAYPQGGGAYKVAMDNLGETPGVVAGASLVVDYTLTVAVSTAAGVAAITSAVPELHDQKVPLAILFVALLTIGNLRGVRESGTIFAVPTYFFLAAFAIMIVTGMTRLVLGDIDHVPHEDVITPGTSSLTLFLLLRAFSSGATALTGIEAISNGVPAFKEPSAKNAATTLTWMAGILTTIFISLTVLAHQIEVQPSETKTVVAQIADAVFGGGVMFYIVQIATALILVLAANTSFAGLPALASVMAKDRYIPRLFSFRGDRLGYSNGIIVLALAAAGLLVAFNAETHSLIPLYALGVFVGFTLSQFGMVRYWRGHPDEPGARRSQIINLVGGSATMVVALIVAATKFAGGAWITITAITLLTLIFLRIHRHYQYVRTTLRIPDDVVPFESTTRRSQPVIVPVDDLNRATARAAAYARSMSDNVTALHVTDNLEDAEALRRDWESRFLDIPLIVVESEYRSLLGPVLAYVDNIDRADPTQAVTVVLPEYRPRYPWQRLLHNQQSQGLKKALLKREHTAVVDVPYHIP